MKKDPELSKLRAKIDRLDSELLKLLNERGAIVKKIGAKKAKHKMNFYAPAREKQIFMKLGKESRGPLSDIAVKTIFREILSACLALEKPLKIAYLGPSATFTHMAVLEKFGSGVECHPQGSIPDVFGQVEKGADHYGVVPIENSSEGTINHTLDMFIVSPLRVCSEVYLNVSHNLLSRHTSLKKIKKLFSNPQAFAQCKAWIRNHLGDNIEMMEVSSTSFAAEIASREPNSGAIASALASEMYNLNMIASSIQDNPQNKTRFLVIGNQMAERSGKDKTSIMFSVKHKAGALFRSLAAFNKYHINMTLIESRPTRMKPWEYVFFADLQGYYTDPPIHKAMKAMEQECLFVKVLGSYPEAD